MPAFLWSKHILWLEDIIILGYMDIYTSLLQSVVSLPNPLQAARWFGIRVKRRLKIWDCCTELQRPEQTRFLSVCVTDKHSLTVSHIFPWMGLDLFYTLAGEVIVGGGDGVSDAERASLSTLEKHSEVATLLAMHFGSVDLSLYLN